MSDTIYIDIQSFSNYIINKKPTSLTFISTLIGCTIDHIVHNPWAVSHITCPCWLHHACHTRASPQFFSFNHPFLCKKLGTLQHEIFDHHGSVDDGCYRFGLYRSCRRSKNVRGIKIRSLGFHYRNGCGVFLLPTLGNTHGWNCGSIFWRTLSRQGGKKSFTSQLGYLRWIHGKYRTETGFFWNSTFLLH